MPLARLIGEQGRQHSAFPQLFLKAANLSAWLRLSEHPGAGAASSAWGWGWPWASAPAFCTKNHLFSAISHPGNIFLPPPAAAESSSWAGWVPHVLPWQQPLHQNSLYSPQFHGGFGLSRWWRWWCWRAARAGGPCPVKGRRCPFGVNSEDSGQWPPPEM